ncbi:cache domain-containing protein [Pelotalea chapellei]|uniref:cache domain-containing protein n=1 Tax=Pelotalea chapellei TaxID=44671 RepID=UPI001FE3BFA2|nr:cache domain-containing protein [Pelotalea chapellei]
MLSFFKDYRIRTKLLLIMLFAGIPVTASIAFLLISEYRTDLRESEHAIQVTTEAIAAQHEAYLNGIHTLLVTVSQFPEVKQRDPERCKQLLQTILKKNPTSLNIGIADIQGNLIASGVNATFSIADRKYFKDALRTKRFSVGEYVISRAVGKPAIHFALPVLTDTGNVSAVIYTTFDLTHFNSIFRAQHLPPNSALNITDHNGVLLHRYPDHPVVKQGILDRQDLRERMTGPRDEGVFNEIGMDKTKRFLAFKRLRLHPDERPYLYIRVSIPESEALANANQHLAIMAGMLAVASLLALWTTHFFSRRFFIKPLERLATVARSAEHEDFSVRSGLEKSGVSLKNNLYILRNWKASEFWQAVLPTISIIF